MKTLVRIHKIISIIMLIWLFFIVLFIFGLTNSTLINAINQTYHYFSILLFNYILSLFFNNDNNIKSICFKSIMSIFFMITYIVLLKNAKSINYYGISIFLCVLEIITSFLILCSKGYDYNKNI